MNGMEKNNEKERAAVFIDLENVLSRGRDFDKDLRIDFEGMIDNLAEDRELTGVYMFAGAGKDGSESTFHEMLRGKGFTVITRMCYDPDKGKQREIDVALACEVLSQAYTNSYDIAIIVSGDRDFRPVIEQIRSLGKKAEVAGFTASMSKVLSRSCDVFHNMDRVPLFYLTQKAIRRFEEFVSAFFRMFDTTAAAYDIEV
ncbi:MAG: NYN domain-containing protein [Methanomassiliicoccaceae archaeon]|nr:NYN domain-containing protein [Methanomassiliicoccaceae archaeon]